MYVSKYIVSSIFRPVWESCIGFMLGCLVKRSITENKYYADMKMLPRKSIY